jgi:hypothetical protein
LLVQRQRRVIDLKHVGLSQSGINGELRHVSHADAGHATAWLFSF